MKLKMPIVVATLAALACLNPPAIGQERHERERGREPLHLDQRYQHDHYYPPRGYATRVLPQGSMRIIFRGSPYLFHAGVWWRPEGSGYVVIVPPAGVFVPALPPAYVTLSVAGAPYYYANGVYYSPVPGQGYTVVAPPPGAEAVQPAAPPQPQYPPIAAAVPITYPRNGQSPAQTESDRQQCSGWAGTQPGATTNPEVFQRAIAACMDGRGYTMR